MHPTGRDPWTPAGQRAALEARFEEMLRKFPGDPWAAALDATVYLIGWLERTPTATRAWYDATVSRVRSSGVVRGPSGWTPEPGWTRMPLGRWET